MDRKPVNLISNYHEVEIKIVQRKKKDERKIFVTYLKLVKDYNNHMGGVDQGLYKYLHRLWC